MSFITGNPNIDFFEQNPELQYKPQIKKLISSVGLEEASKVMWTVYLLEDINSPFYRIPREDRIKEVQQEYYPIDLDKHKELIDSYASMAMSKEESLFKAHMDTLDKLTSHLKNLDMDSDKQLNSIVKILEKLPKIWDGLEKVKTRMIDAQKQTIVRGGAKESAREKRNRSRGSNEHK